MIVNAKIEYQVGIFSKLPDALMAEVISRAKIEISNFGGRSVGISCLPTYGRMKCTSKGMKEFLEGNNILYRLISDRNNDDELRQAVKGFYRIYSPSLREAIPRILLSLIGRYKGRWDVRKAVLKLKRDDLVRVINDVFFLRGNRFGKIELSLKTGKMLEFMQSHQDQEIRECIRGLSLMQTYGNKSLDEHKGELLKKGLIGYYAERESPLGKTAAWNVMSTHLKVRAASWGGRYWACCSGAGYIIAFIVACRG